jgi:hypothetical protein
MTTGLNNTLTLLPLYISCHAWKYAFLNPLSHSQIDMMGLGCAVPLGRCVPVCSGLVNGVLSFER